MRVVWRAAVGDIESALARRRLNRAPQPSWPVPFPDRPVGVDTRPEIRHIVVLMMENHSYDNYLGMLDRGEGLPRDNSGNPTATNLTGRGHAVISHRLPSTKQYPLVPSQAWDASQEQWSDGRNDGFVRSAEAQHQPVDPGTAMGYWTEEDLPFYCALARTFPLADRWFSSCLGPTFPNRRFLVAGTAHGLTSDKLSLIWVYDEHGGYYDHVPPPEAPEPDNCPPEGGGPWAYDRYGFRVPAVIVAPYARAGYVSHQVHDHTSILKLIETKWNLPPLTRRDALADDLLDSLDFSGPPAFAQPPDLPPPARSTQV
ncbi:MAG TPA: alkaline phosphatase family protein [Acidimicrobiales bacterium]|jgi:phospholipase C|nr:alkaline phosphatase family protein [Acidimicrobiales bacterium]